jgi:RNA polymerase sigma-70 factor (ECF subfamily)
MQVVDVASVSKDEELTDLVRRIMLGDSLAEAEMVERYKEGLPTIIGQIVHNRSATEDLSQETFMKAIAKIRRGELRDPARLSGFICGIARFMAIEYVRKGRRLINKEEIGETEQLADPAPSQLDEICQQERCDAVRQVLSEMKIERDREVLRRYYIEEEDKEHICQDLGLTATQFSRIVFRALDRYKKLYLKVRGAA